MAKWVIPQAPDCGTQYEVIPPVEILTYTVNGVTGLGARFGFPTWPGQLKLCYRFNYYPPASGCRQKSCALHDTSGYMIFENIRLNVIEYDHVVPFGTAMGCSSVVTVRGRGFLAGGGGEVLPVTCGFDMGDHYQHTRATILNDTAISCATAAPTVVGTFPMRLDWGHHMFGLPRGFLSTEHPDAFTSFVSFSHDVNMVTAVRPAAGPYQDTAAVDVYGSFVNYGQPGCRFGSWMGSWATWINRTYVRCEKPPFPATERGITGAYPVFFTGNAQCEPTGDPLPSDSLVGTGGSFRTYNAQIDGLSVNAGPDTSTTPLVVFGEGIVYPSVVGAVCRFTRTHIDLGSGWILMPPGLPSRDPYGVLRTAALALGTSQLTCNPPAVPVARGNKLRYEVETLQNGVSIDPTNQGTPFTYDIYDMSSVVMTDLQPRAGPIGASALMTLSANGIVDYGNGQLSCVVTRNSTDVDSATGALIVPGRLLSPTQVLCELTSEMTMNEGTIAFGLSLNSGLPNTVTHARYNFQSYSHPTLTAVIPSEGSAFGGYYVVINGTGFMQYSEDENDRIANLRCKFGANVQPLPPLAVNNTFIVCMVPPGTERIGGALITITLNNEGYGYTGEPLYFNYRGWSPPVLFSAFFDADGTRLTVRFDGKETNRAGMVGDGPCSSVLDMATVTQLAGAAPRAPTCSWQDGLTLIVYLTVYTDAAPGMLVGIKRHVLWPRAWEHSIEYISDCNAPGAMCAAGQNVTVGLTFPCDDAFTPEREQCIVPTAAINAPAEIASCMDTTSLTIDGSISYGSGIKPLTYRWVALPALCDNYFVINPFLTSRDGAATADGMSPTLNLAPAQISGGMIFTLQLTVSNFLGGASTPTTVTVIRNALPIPTVVIPGPRLMAIAAGRSLPLEAEARIASCFASDTTRRISFEWTADGRTPLTGPLGLTRTRRTLRLAGSLLRPNVNHLVHVRACMVDNPSACR